MASARPGNQDWKSHQEPRPVCLHTCFCFSPTGCPSLHYLHFFPVSSPLFQVLTVNPSAFEIPIPIRNLIGSAWIPCPPLSNQSYKNGHQHWKQRHRQGDVDTPKGYLRQSHRTCRVRTESPSGLSEQNAHSIESLIPRFPGSHPNT